MPFQKGFFIPMEEPVDPGWGHPGGGLRPGHRPENPIELPEGPVDPGFGYPLPPVIDNGLPGERPPHVGNRPPGTLPPRPGHPLPPERPTFPVDPEWGLPGGPGVWPLPPKPDWPPVFPGKPELPIYKPDPEPGGPEVSPPIVLPPGTVWPPLPPVIPEGVLICICWIVGVGYRWVAIDTGNKPDIKPPQLPGKPGQGLPPHPQPK